MDLQMSLAIARRRTQLRSSREKRHYTFAASIDLLNSIRRSKDRLDPNKLCRASHKSTSHQRGQASHWPTTEAMHLCTLECTNSLLPRCHPTRSALFLLVVG